MSPRQRLTALVLVCLLLLGLVLLEGWYVWLRGAPRPTAERPVTVSEVVQATAVDTAQKSTAEILSTTWKGYDDQATQAEALMTDSFAAEYAQTSADIRQEFLRTRTTVTYGVAWAGVYRASADQAQVLMFLDQVVTKKGGGPTTTPYRALVSVVRDADRGWLVADIQTR
jgi:Mce-associated membrane protein